MKPFVTYPDATSTLASILRDALASRAEPFAQNAHVSTVVPVERSLDTSSSPYILVAQDAFGDVRQSALLVASVRVTCWGATEDDTFDLAALCHALLVSYRGDAEVRSMLPLGAPFLTEDVATDQPIASFEVTANLLPRKAN